VATGFQPVDRTALRRLTVLDPPARAAPGPDAAGAPASEPRPDGPDPGASVGPDVRRQTDELADRLRALSAVDPELARAVVTQLVVALNRATDGAFAAHLSPAARAALGLAGDRKGPIGPGSAG